MFFLDELKKHKWVLLLACCYVVINMILTFKSMYYLNILPLVLIVMFLGIFRLDLLFFLIVACTPLSIPLIEFVRSSPIDFAIPTEPLMFGLMIIVFYKVVHEQFLDRQILKHPVTIAILVYLFWIFVTSVTSSMPLVSFKFLLAKIWFITTFYLMAIYVFRKTTNIKAYIWSYVLPMLVIVIYTTNRHLVYGLFDRQASHSVMEPFFRDHTSYGAVSAMLLFALLGIVLTRNKNIYIHILSFFALALITLALILSYTRAAWLSAFLALGILTITFLRIKFKYIVLAVVLAGIYYGSKRIELVQKMEQNRQASSAEISEHLKSISNIKSDKSNIERLNRWSSAIGLFREYPVFGWGPGTYIFKYAPYQPFKYKTSISTNFGDKGNAHSEYLGPLAEQGLFGPIAFILIGVVSLITGFRVYFRIQEKALKYLVLGLISGLCTYFFHGLMNNFLDTDKISALFWGFIAVFVSLDIYYYRNDINVPDKEAIKEENKPV